MSTSNRCDICDIKEPVMRDIAKTNIKLEKAVEKYKDKSDCLADRIVVMEKQLEEQETEMADVCNKCNAKESLELAEARLSYALSKSFWYMIADLRPDNWGELKTLVMTSDPRIRP